MLLRFNALYFNSPGILLRNFVGLVFLLSLNNKVLSQVTNEETIKEANRLFEEDEFTKAYKLYAQIVANYPKDPVYNFKLGVCMIYSEVDKKKCIPYLEIANKQPEEAPKEVKFYMGKAMHINYRFDEALKYYNDYQKIGSKANLKKLQVDREIRACVNGKRLLSNLTDLEILNKKTLNEADFFRSYEVKSLGGKLLVTPEDFKTSTDKKKKDKSIVYLPKSNDVVYYSSYGPNKETGKDIYYRTKQANGQFGEPILVKGINTEFDEDYPFLHPNGTTLYFASKGHNSMGGYDIFKSNFIEETNSWTAPVNLEFPINSPDDDFLFVTDSLEKTAYFSTGRQSLPGKIDVLKINTERKPIDVLALKGSVLKENESQSVKSKITVKNLDGGNLIGVYESEENGDYLMDLPNGSKLLFTVETPGIRTQSDKVSLPLATTSKALKQTITYDKGVLKITNYFEGTASDDSYVQYLKIIEQKAKLEVNEGKNNLNTAIAKNDTIKSNLGNTDSNTGPSVIEDTTAVKTQTQAVVSNSIVASNSSKLNNEELSKIAKQDAEESSTEAKNLQQDANDGFELGNLTKIEAEKKIKNGNEMLQNAESITDEQEKKTATEEAQKIIKEGEAELKSANEIITYAKVLDDDAKNKNQIAVLNKQYVDELDKVMISKKKNPESLEKLETIRKEIDIASSKKNNSENTLNNLKLNADQKELEFKTLESANTTIKNDIADIKTEIKVKETELSTTRKKKDKEPIQTKINELNEELNAKEKELENNENSLALAKNEMEAAKNTIELANKIKTENIAKPIDVASNNETKTTEITPTKNNNTSAEKIDDSKLLADKYGEKITVSNPKEKTSFEIANTQLINYNKEIDAAINKNKSLLAKTKNASNKQKLSQEIKKLENTKKQNQQLIASNKKSISELDQLAKSEKSNSDTNINPISANNNQEALNQLDKLKVNLKINDNANFDYNSYQNTEAQSLKVEADAKINESVVQQKKLKEDIEAATEKVKNSNSNNTNSNANYEKLNIEAEELSLKAFELRKEANTKTGTEKDNLIAQANENDKKADEKHLEAVAILESNNKEVFNTNTVNLKTLLQLNKASEMDVNETNRLMEEANLSFKQAAAIREEGNAQSNVAAKLGNFSNAEEKEAEALSKQKQALYIMQKTSGNIALKEPQINSSSAPNPDLNNQLADVNNTINNLNDSRLGAYLKLYEANQSEINSLKSSLNESGALNNPSFKSEVNKINSNITAYETDKSNSDSQQNSAEKLNILINASKKQIETILLLNEINKKASQTLAVNTNTKSNENLENKTSNENKGSDNTENSTNENTEQPVVTNTVTENANNNKNNTTDNKAVKNNSNENPIAVETKTYSIEELSNEKTSPKNVIEELSTNPNLITNPGANAQMKEALASLEKIQKQKTNLDENKGNADVKISPAENVKSDAELLLEEAEELSVKAYNERTLANTKEGEEKDSIMNIAMNHEKESQAKKLNAVQLTESANKSIFESNKESINELMEKAKTDNPTLASQLEYKLNDINTLNTQSNQLREEANGQTNTNAKIGAMMNAEEKEDELIILQNTVLMELKNQYPNYTTKKAVVNLSDNSNPEEIARKKKELGQKESGELTKLTNAFSLEFEMNKTNLPENLNEDQNLVKQNAEQLNAESKRILIQAENESDLEEKNNKLALAAKIGQKSVEQLNKITPQNKSNNQLAVNNKTKTNKETKTNVLKENKTNKVNTTKTNKEPKENVAQNNSNENKNNKENKTKAELPNNNTGGNETVKIEGLAVVKGNAYSDAKPIPIDAKMPDGLMFRVQIGAFKTQLPNNTFKGLNPLNGENAPNGYIRYTAGNFNKIEIANAVKNDLQKLGYSDAFVVVYYNGKRISLTEALAIMSNEGKQIDNNAPTSMGITSNVNIPKVNNPPATLNNETANVTQELEKINGLLFTVQIGVYSKQASKKQLLNLSPIYTEKLPTGLFRYTAGVYNNTEKLLSDKAKVVTYGVKDAFVSAYLNGKRISFAEGKTAKENAATQLEAENPIIFPANPANENNNPEPEKPINNTPKNNAPTDVKPFTNNVSSYPKATPDNGIKESQEGVCFKVQIGAYSKQVPNDVAAKFMSIKTWPIENKQVNSLFIYNIGNFTSAQFAKSLKLEAINAGITDAFITVYKDGVKLFGAEASTLLNQ
ncbi:MAG: PD40 domain-containing protein [Sphingobacteriaceae bacterium]|nr:PD40 domain-containing protein [Sphingobacteriaceae bacterium]